LHKGALNPRKEGHRVSHDIVTKIVARDGVVTVERAHAARRPLVFVRGEDEKLSRIYREDGLHALLAAVSREVHRGNVHLRSRSAITRLLNHQLQLITLERFKAMDEDEAAELLATLAEGAFTGA
ncbi:MAG: hypothetical protein PUB51_02255, partial [Oscillospiraceae bacterium]|nr:hypothetical protein [Oscillospiraceae bacterium]